MKKIIPVILMALAACAKTPDDSVLKDIFKVGEAKSQADAEKYYSSGTVNLSRKIGGDILLSYDRKLFEKGSEYILIRKNISGESGIVRVKIQKHRSINLTDYEIDIPVRFEGNRWKIDREDDLGKILSRK